MFSTPSKSISMNLLADESVDGPIVARLRQEGHEIVYVAELSPSITDEEVLQQANARAALLVTADKDFGEVGIPPTPGALWSRAPALGWFAA